MPGPGGETLRLIGVSGDPVGFGGSTTGGRLDRVRMLPGGCCKRGMARWGFCAAGGGGTVVGTGVITVAGEVVLTGAGSVVVVAVGGLGGAE